MAPKKNVIIIGAGGSGAHLARALSGTLNPTSHSLILIASRDYYLQQPAALRMLTSDKGHLEEDGKALVPFDRLFLSNVGTFVHAEVTSIVRNSSGKGGKIITDSGKEYEYAVLVLATGSIWEGALDFPPTKSAAIAHINKWRQDIKAAKGVAIVGGGAVGVELAGEIRDIYPEKPISIVQRGHHLFSAVYPDKFRVDVEARLTRRLIKLVLNDGIDEAPAYPASRVVTAGGQRLDADLIIPTRGGRPNTAFIASLGDGVLTSSGHVLVNPTLQLRNIPDIFAMGDILDWDEIKQYAKYGKHVTTVQANIMSLLEGRQVSVNYKSMFEAIFISIGAGGGAAYLDVLWGLCFGDKITRAVKSGTLFVEKTAAKLGYT